ncbi:3858_t:CDS:1, partial [Gigaspora rosea]
CKGSNLKPADGTQNPNGDCVSTAIGELPTKNNMVSTIIKSPDNGQTLQENTPFTVVTQTNNLNAGFFSDPATQYYVKAQSLGNNGKINGHSHITIQQIDGQTPPDPTKFAFFKGLNNGTDNNGDLTVDVANGLPAGNYRICTMVSSESHQCVTMPVAQRGAQDDCIRIK